jgi:NADPH2:quinone reductase
MHAWVHTRAELEEASGAVFEVMKSGAVKINPPKTFALSAAADAHRALEGRQTSGSVVLLP